MNKFAFSALTAAVVMGFSLPAAADALTLYGKLNLSVQSNDEGDGSYTEVASNASRLGVKGDYDLGNGLEAFYTVEWQVDTRSKGDNFEARNQFVGLRGAFGETFIGRSDTAFKSSQGKIDLFGDLEGDIKNLFVGEDRMGQTVNYVTPAFNQIKATLTYAADEDSEGDDGYAASVAYGDAKLKKTPIFASVAYNDTIKGYDSVRVSAYGKLGDFKLGAMYQTSEDTDDSDIDGNGYLVNAAYSLDKLTFKAQYQDADMEFAKYGEGKAVSVGVDYKLAKPTKVFAFYTDYSLDNEGEADRDYFGLGLEHKF